MDNQLIDIDDLAKCLKIPAKTIRNKLSNHTWPIQPVRIGRALRWRESDVAAMIARLSAESGKRMTGRP
jgi:predicted DNA-binding transcriptional regulator AlpA